MGFIKKRDGRSERFDGAKIVEAMRSAFEDVADEQAAARGLIAGHGASVPAVSADELEALHASIEQAIDRNKKQLGYAKHQHIGIEAERNTRYCVCAHR